MDMSDYFCGVKQDYEQNKERKRWNLNAELCEF